MDAWLEAIRFCNHLSRVFDLSPAYRLESEARPLVKHLIEATGYHLPTEA